MIIDFTLYMTQHILYIKRLQISLENKTEFSHKLPTECVFGKMFYKDIKPNLVQFSDKKRQLIEQIELIHIDFHHEASKINPHINPDWKLSQNNAWLHSSRLINMLTNLEKNA